MATSGPGATNLVTGLIVSFITETTVLHSRMEAILDSSQKAMVMMTNSLDNQGMERVYQKDAMKLYSLLHAVHAGDMTKDDAKAESEKIFTVKGGIYLEKVT